MAKNKKSKILASILAVSTMAVFYAAPVMAGSVNSIEGDSSGIHFDFGYKKDSNTSISDGEINGSDGIYVAGPAGNEIGGITHTIVGKFTITSDAVINALEGKTFNDLTINNLDTTNLTVNGKTVDLSQLENVKGITRSAGATTPGTGTTTIEGVLSVDGTTGEIYQEDGAFSVDEDGDLIAKSVTDGVYDLATIGKNTQKIKFDGENTVVAGKLVADKFGTTNNSFWVTKDGAISAANNKFSVGASGEVKAANGNFEIKNNGNVTATAVKVGEYDLETIGKNTQKVTFNGKETVVAGKLVADKFGTSNDAFYVDENGTIKGNSLIIGKNGDNAVFKVDRNGNTEIKGNVTMAKDATVDGVDVSELGGNVAGISRNNGDLPYGQGVTSIEGVVSVDGQSGFVNFSTGNGNGVLINSSQGQIIANQVVASSVGANNVATENLTAGNGALRVSENGDILMQNGSGESISMTDGGLNLMSTDNGTGMVTLRDGSVSLMGNGTSTVTVDENGTTFGTVLGSETTNINGGTVTASGDFVTVDENGETKYTLNTIGDNTQAIQYKDGVTTIGGDTLAVTNEGYVTINNGAFAIGPDGMATVGSNIKLDGETGVVSANDLKAINNVYSKNYNLEKVGADLANLGTNVDNIGGNVAGISRNNGDLPYGQGVTSIEGVVSVDGQSGFVNFSTGNGNGVLINSSQGQIIANQVVASSVGANNVATENLTAGNGALRVSENGDILMQNGSGESISMTDGGLNLMSTDNGTGMVTLRDGSVSLMGNGTSTVTVDENGTTFGTVLGSETTNINGGTVTASGDFVTVDENGETKYTLNTIGDNTQAIQYKDGVTTIGGDTLAVTNEGYVTINNGAFAIGPDGMATVGSNIKLDGETGVVSANDLKAINNVYSKNYNLEEVGADLKELSGDFTTTNANVAGIKRTGSDEEGWTTTLDYNY